MGVPPACASRGEIMTEQEPLHCTVVPDTAKAPQDWTLAEWQGVLEELHYQRENTGNEIYGIAHDGMRWLVAYFLARRMNA